MATFTCKAEGYPQPKIEWKLNRKPISSYGRVTLWNNGENLEIADIRGQDNGDIACIAENIMGIARASTTIVVHGKCFCSYIETLYLSHDLGQW